MRYFVACVVWCSVVAGVQAQDYIERAYFPNAQARNAAIAAARYAEEGYHYTRFTIYTNAIDSSRVYADTALFFVKRSMMLCDTSLHHAPASNQPAIDYLLSGKTRISAADSVIRGFYPMVELRSHHFFGREATYHLSGAVMDFFSASLLLRPEDASLEVAEQYDVLPFEDEITRLEADEVAFQHLINAYEHEVRNLEMLAENVQKEIDKAPDQKTRVNLRSWIQEINLQMQSNTVQTESASHRIQEIRVLLDRKYLRDLEGVEAPEHLAQFETNTNKPAKLTMDEELPEGLVYKIQLGYYPSDVDVNYFRGLFPITGETVRKGTSKIFAGMFYSYSEASKGLDYVRKNAIANAFIVPFHSGAQISLSRAVEIEKMKGVK